jgi:hypothetical protein
VFGGERVTSFFVVVCGAMPRPSDMYRGLGEGAGKCACGHVAGWGSYAWGFFLTLLLQIYVIYDMFHFVSAS